MLIHALTVPIDDFDDMTPLPAWLHGDPARTRWALQAVLALADAGLRIGWKGDMRHLPSVGRHDDGTPFLVVKQDTRGTTFIVTQATETPVLWLAGLAGCCLHVDPRDIGDWTHPTSDDIIGALTGHPAGGTSIVPGGTGPAGDPPF